MALASFLGLLVLGGLGVVAARRIATERRVLLHVLAVAALLAVVARALVGAFPASEAWLDGPEIVAYLEPNLAIPFGVFFFAVAARLVPEERNRRALSVLPVLLSGYLAYDSLWTLRTPRCWQESENLWTRGVCRQSYDFTCGAASIATLVSRLGHPLSEHEAARLSATRPGKGVTNLGAAMGLRRALPGRKVTIRNARIDEIPGLPLPCLASFKYSFWFDHMVVILEADPKKGILVGDPLMGPSWYPPVGLVDRWRGQVITVE